MRKGNLFKKTLNSRHFGAKTTHFDKEVHKPKDMTTGRCLAITPRPMYAIGSELYIDSLETLKPNR